MVHLKDFGWQQNGFQNVIPGEHMVMTLFRPKNQSQQNNLTNICRFFNFKRNLELNLKFIVLSEHFKKLH